MNNIKSSRFTILATSLATSLATALLISACGGGASAQTQAPTAPSTTTTASAGISQFGEDADGNGVPDRLDAFVSNMKGGPETKAAAASYFRLISMLSVKTLAGEKLTEAEKQKVFDSLGCFSLTVDYEGAIDVDLDAEFMKNKIAFNGMYSLMAALNGTFAGYSPNKTQMCTRAK